MTHAIITQVQSDRRKTVKGARGASQLCILCTRLICRLIIDSVEIPPRWEKMSPFLHDSPVSLDTPLAERQAAEALEALRLSTVRDFPLSLIPRLSDGKARGEN